MKSVELLAPGVVLLVADAVVGAVVVKLGNVVAGRITVSWEGFDKRDTVNDNKHWGEGKSD